MYLSGQVSSVIQLISCFFSPQSNFIFSQPILSRQLLEFCIDYNKSFLGWVQQKSKSETTRHAWHGFSINNINNKLYQEVSKESILYICLQCQSNTFPFFDKSNSDVSLLNSGFNNFRFSSDTNIFQGENLNNFLQSVTPQRLLLMILIILSLQIPNAMTLMISIKLI